MNSAGCMAYYDHQDKMHRLNDILGMDRIIMEVSHMDYPKSYSCDKGTYLEQPITYRRRNFSDNENKLLAKHETAFTIRKDNFKKRYKRNLNGLNANDPTLNEYLNYYTDKIKESLNDNYTVDQINDIFSEEKDNNEIKYKAIYISFCQVFSEMLTIPYDLIITFLNKGQLGWVEFLLSKSTDSLLDKAKEDCFNIDAKRLILVLNKKNKLEEITYRQAVDDIIEEREEKDMNNDEYIKIRNILIEEHNLEPKMKTNVFFRKHLAYPISQKGGKRTKVGKKGKKGKKTRKNIK